MQFIFMWVYFQLLAQQQWQQPDNLSQQFSGMAYARPLCRFILQWNEYGVQSSSAKGSLCSKIA
jgi:hypothetical protein